jgi:hypothetical protein
MPQSTLENTHILERILREAHSAVHSGERFLAAFDLDSTLFDLTLRISGIIDEFLADSENRRLFAAECEALKKMEILRTDWGVDQAMARVGITQQSHPKFVRAVLDFWSYHFFSDQFLHRDEPLPGAVDFVQELHRSGAHIMYLTGRDVPRMLKGTNESLKTWNFPLDHHSARLVLKPSAALDDASFKVAILKEAERNYDHMWLFENEPVNINLVARHCPSIGLVFIDTTHSGVETVSPNLARLPHFEVDLEEFKKFSHHFRGK